MLWSRICGVCFLYRLCRTCTGKGIQTEILEFLVHVCGFKKNRAPSQGGPAAKFHARGIQQPSSNAAGLFTMAPNSQTISFDGSLWGSVWWLGRALTQQSICRPAHKRWTPTALDIGFGKSQFFSVNFLKNNLLTQNTRPKRLNPKCLKISPAIVVDGPI